MDGILIIDKPEGLTSHDVVDRVRRILKTRRVGHTGTLDPFATGVMVVLVGQATRLAQFLDKDEKEYLAAIRFGFETDTGDRTGERKAVEASAPPETLSETGLDTILEGFRGDILQVPPMYSAKKVGGEKLYELARRGETIEREAVPVTIRELEPVGGLNHQQMNIRAVCSAGTYIRVLAEDIGRAAGTGAHLAELRRTRAGRFSIDDAVTLDDLAELPTPDTRILSIRDAIAHLPVLELSDERSAKTRNGLSTLVFDRKFTDREAVRMESPAGEVIAIGRYVEAENVVQPKVVLI